MGQERLRALLTGSRGVLLEDLADSTTSLVCDSILHPLLVLHGEASKRQWPCSTGSHSDLMDQV